MHFCWFCCICCSHIYCNFCCCAVMHLNTRAKVYAFHVFHFFHFFHIFCLLNFLPFVLFQFSLQFLHVFIFVIVVFVCALFFCTLVVGVMPALQGWIFVGLFACVGDECVCSGVYVFVCIPCCCNCFCLNARCNCIFGCIPGIFNVMRVFLMLLLLLLVFCYCYCHLMLQSLAIHFNL